MAKFEITTEEERERFIDVMQKKIDEIEPEKQHKILDREIAKGGFKDNIQKVLRENIDTRYTMLQMIRDDIKASKLPVSMEGMRDKLVMAFSMANISPDYSRLVIDIIEAAKLPEEMTRQIKALSPKGTAFVGGLPMRGTEFSMGRVKEIEMRASTVQIINQAAFNSLYTACTGKEPGAGRDFTHFRAKMEKLLGQVPGANR